MNPNRQPGPPFLTSHLEPVIRDAADRLRWSILAVALLLLVPLPAVADPPPAQPDSSLAGSPEVRDPLFQFFLELIEEDRLGRWTQAEVQAYIQDTGRPSRLPADKVAWVERRTASGPERQKRRGERVDRVWTLALTEPLKIPMPYSILGYHPGSLVVSERLVMSEWSLGEPNLHVAKDGVVQIFPTTLTTALRFDRGWVVLDADALIDKLLGNKLDDFWTEGFAFCRVQGQLFGLAAGRGRNRQALFGEFDLRRDKVISRSGPVAKGLSRYVRPWLAPPDGTGSRIWEFGD
jgi:hypothetical protein